MNYVFNHVFQTYKTGLLSLQPLTEDNMHKEVFEFIKTRLVESVTKENISIIYLDGKFIGFLQLNPFSAKKFQKDYGDKDYPFELSHIKEGEEHTVVIENLFISSKHQGKYIGQSIVRFLQDVLEDKTLLLYSLAEAEEFWMNMGFQDNGDYVYSWLKENTLRKTA
ncbi:GNAT family N-acetyltransferase [Bacillus sp. NPDC094106]|uniref:GNAT family N-acetyltransferase n=1 Tax=Bacillus sp. NPDC094106 TaxID=3363949 RepID=UPI0037F8DEE9